ncbi:oxidoreductase [Phycicoccus sp. Root563]|uniref:Gfo/Idh/MocA family protein n=1 Tax=Phycicoccus sp. Root563 TaxID=1736562 RepID=UPI00070352F8|nr:Gfo/Idh/MocA family oxidoreductase [Phycicoccus sp. Root563]KQZ90051.1 oxidoreductase [Phycicoccus sp. Root563]
MTSALRLPAPRVPDPRSAPVLRWGVIAPGGIARTFGRALRARTGQELRAVASRSLDRAQEYQREFDVEVAYGSYEELVADPHVDAVYVASPHSEHLAHAQLALEAGKPVLVEKAFTRTGAEARAVFDTAERAGLFAMEAMWTRFLPHMDVVRQVLEQGLLGEVQVVAADHGQKLYPDGPQRLSDPALAGGALLDLCVYPISFASMVLGEFDSLSATGLLTTEGVDAQEVVTVQNAAGALGLLSASMVSSTPTTASISGTRARLEFTGAFYGQSTMTLLSPHDEVLDVLEPSDREHGLHHEIVEVAACVDARLLESPLLPWAETLRVMDAMDAVREQIGFRLLGE